MPRTVRPDLSYGRVKIHYQDNAGHQHVASLHFASITSDVDPWVFTAAGAHAANVRQLVDVWGLLFNFVMTNTFSVTLVEVFKNGTGGAELPIGSFSPLTPIVGGEPGPVVPASQFVYSGRTLSNSPIKFIFLDVSGTNFNVNQLPRGSFASAEDTAVGELETERNLLGHDGTRLAAIVRRTSPLNRRLRRHYHMA